MTQGGTRWRLQCYAALESTQTAAIIVAQQGGPDRLAIIADLQTAGRGSRGRTWVAPEGNLNLSVLLRASGPPDPGRWALHAGVALYEALAGYTSDLMLKWPNDLLLCGRKLGGVLIDSGLRSDGTLDWVVIGVGANLVRAPTLHGSTAACLPPPCPAAEDVAHAFMRSFDRWCAADVRSAWLARAHPRGTAIDVITPHRRISGSFAGLSPRGELLLEGADAPISSADVFLAPITPQPLTPCFSL